MALRAGAVGAVRCPSYRAEQAEQVEKLRRQMASLSEKMAGKGGGAAPAATFGSGNLRAAAPCSEPLPGPDYLLVPDSLAELLPGPLPRGTVAVLSGARSLELSMVAAVTAQGGHVAIIGQPDIGLLAAVEMGADLSRVAVIPEPGTDRVEVAAVLLDGMDLVVLALGGRTVSATRARAVVARARQRGCTLLITDGDWQGASARLDASVTGYEVVGAGRGAPTPGCGRISRVRLATRAQERSGGPARALGR
ncbi:MAG: hypothetical protein K0U76_02425 [Actinomycetia bacterium]|nr:hypothetical protein [Actinomycetes bacterium]MCH9700232.1 hypothetical protein [Actinomycetes bacterium]MCH9761096.1 hypothetical protein [Actinomycetes bacterium]